ncbi:MAG: type II toxin-antitoxin system VapC family toxin [Syntrophales bacterium]|jgi:predicted nucleic acid-binding protein|nr:type II toxin-antitoxin system VapC family toxin [Syntrophales bacterium]
MILYLDTSALVKRYFKEPYSDEIIFRWKSAVQIVTSFVAYAETMASINRKKREAELADTLIREAVDSFLRDWESFIRVEVSGEINGYIDRVVEKYPLRGFDAIHLASALAIREVLPEDFVFACFDDRLSRAARSEGLQTFPPEDTAG